MAAKTVRNSPPVGPEPWEVTGYSVLGASHRRKGTENQDHIKYHDERGRAIIALADGHGSAKSFRSAKGSELAVKVSYGFAWELLRAASGGGDRFLSFVKDQVETEIPRRIVHSWTKQVDEHLGQNPFTERELTVLEQQGGPQSRRQVEQDGRLAYGSTLITAIALESFAVFWQIGDGDVLTVSSNREVSRPVPKDARLIANETTSLCSPDAWRMFRCAILGTPAPMIMLSTDGFANSFLDDEGFFKFGSDVSDIIVEQGLAKVAADLPDWLAEITQRGSGDDISLGIICRPNALTPSPQPPPATVPHPRPVEPPAAVEPPRVPAGPPTSPVLPTVAPSRPEWPHPPTVVDPRAESPAAVGSSRQQSLDPAKTLLDETPPPEESPESPDAPVKKKWWKPWSKGEKGQDDPDPGKPNHPRAEPGAQDDARDRRNK